MFEDMDDGSEEHLKQRFGNNAQKWVPVENMSQEELLMLRAEIDKYLNATKLSDMNLTEELVIQFQTAKAVQMEVLGSMEEANKKAQMMNTCTAVLQNLVKMQTELHTAERLKEIESRLIKALEKVPSEYLEDFFEWYENAE